MPPSRCLHWPRAAWLACLALSIASEGLADPRLLVQSNPSQFDLTVAAGDTTSRSLFLHNLGAVPVEVRVRLADLTLGPRGELELLALGDTPASLGTVVELEPRRLTIGPGRREAVRVRVRMPVRDPATRYGVVLSEVRALAPMSTPGVATPPAELGTTLFVTTLGPDSIHAELLGLDARPAAGGTLRVGLRLRNRCRRHLVGSGDFTVVDSTRRTIERGRLMSGLVLPGAERLFSWYSDHRLPPGRYTVIASVDAGEAELLVGETEVLIDHRVVEPTAIGDDDQD